MGETWEAGRPPNLHFDWQPSLLNSLCIPPNLGQPNPMASSIGNNMVMTKGTFPVTSALKVPQSQVGLVNEPRNWFHCLAPSEQAFLPVKSPIYNDKQAALSKGLSKEAVAPLSGSGTQQKGFLVIDQSADKTTLVLCSGGGGPFQLVTSWSPQPTAAYKFNGEDIGNKRDFIYDSKLVLSNDFAENHENDKQQGEMQEDTEELNALLYSDDESEFDEDDEVTSTGHSPSTMTTKDKQYACEENNEEIASSAGSTKKRKIDRGYDVTSLMDTASSLMSRRFPKYEDDAESSCGIEGSRGMQEVDSSSINKKMRKEKIRETVGILQSLIPGGKGKEAIVVLDEAIQYLKSLRLKAEAFGLNAC